jgi:hypothetical protein
VASRKSLSEIYRPVGPKAIQLGIPWASGGSASISQAIDLSLPIRGIRMVFKGRIVIGGADFTSVNPEGFLNLISNITVQGTNARQKGNLTLYSIDLATLWVLGNMFGLSKNYFSIVRAGVETIVPVPTTPFPPVGATGYASVTQATYDFRIVVDLPFHPFESNAYGKMPLTIPGFLVRNEEWKDSLQVQMTFGAQAGGGATGALGVAAGGSTITYSSFGSGAGTPTIDLYSLPIVMGLDLKDQVLPGVLSRVTSPISAILQAAGQNVPLLNMQKQPTPRVFFKVGTSTVSPAFATLSDTNVTSLGIQLGGNRNVRNVVDIFAHKQQEQDVYDRFAIQGYNLMDFMESGNPDSAYPGQDIGDGATFQLIGNVTGVANAFGLIIQEQMLHIPTGPLYTF